MFESISFEELWVFSKIFVCMKKSRKSGRRIENMNSRSPHWGRRMYQKGWVMSDNLDSLFATWNLSLIAAAVYHLKETMRKRWLAWVAENGAWLLYRTGDYLEAHTLHRILPWSLRAREKKFERSDQISLVWQSCGNNRWREEGAVSKTNFLLISL